jgi:hypothetical protein
MSAALALPSPRRGGIPEQPIRQFEIVTTRAQKRARPRSFYAIVTLSSVFALLLAQLLLSIVLSAGAYQISNLQAQQKLLARTEQALSERLDLLASPQSLATRAESIGMVVSTSAPVFLRLTDGTVIGSAGSANGTKGAIGPAGSLVPNSLLDAAAAEDASPTIGAEDAGGAVSTASVTGSTATASPSRLTGSAASGSLPSPVTR